MKIDTLTEIDMKMLVIRDMLINDLKMPIEAVNEHMKKYEELKTYLNVLRNI